MFYVDILKSKRNGKRYLGYTSKDPSIRLHEHNSGTNKFTRHNKPWILVKPEIYVNKGGAIKREKFLKRGKGREYLDKILTLHA